MVKVLAYFAVFLLKSAQTLIIFGHFLGKNHQKVGKNHTFLSKIGVFCMNFNTF